MTRKRSSFWDHLNEFRATLIKIAFTLLLGFSLTFFFHKPILSWLIAPIESQLVLLSPFEGFAVACKVAFLSALVLTSPLLLIHLLSFILPALYTKERKLLLPLLFASFFFMVGGALFCYGVTLPLALNFLKKFSLGINLWTLTHTVSFILSLLFAHALAFECVVIGFVLTHYAIFTHSRLIQSRRYVYVGLLIASAILTPPDVISQLLLALPLTLLFEGMILYSKQLKKFEYNRLKKVV
ncbi:MAG: Sec-independent protein translocase protein TatC [Chlamydiales bacterium]|nr:Sec-independent protein translocase protein TatC [Chlamydiales bacterium]MCH9619604.1 Sec-independent protein translocase protein TatC [Chlamydiales bacterium]MCH9623210.1 Sec-independent protein translocase protein TatC [Chlamydiales bacterium]